MSSIAKKYYVIGMCLVAFLIGFYVEPLKQFFYDVSPEFNADSQSKIDTLPNTDEKKDPSIAGRADNVIEEGFHTWISPKGNLYVGFWKNGNLKHGTYVSDNSVYEGEFLNLHPHGYGVMYYNNGDIYRGCWSGSYKEGIGLKYNHDGSMYFGRWHRNNPVDGDFRNFKNVYGIDISHYQPSDAIDWKNLALYSNKKEEVYASKAKSKDYMQPVVFAFIKATDGQTPDEAYKTHMENARKHGLIVGSYHFFRIDVGIDEQIRCFINNSQWKMGDLPPVLDMENENNNKNPKEQKAYIEKLRKYGIKRMHSEALKWLEAIEAHYHVKPIIYTSQSWKRDFLQDKELGKYDYWMSKYYNIKPASEYPWIFWQRTDQAEANGYYKPKPAKSNIDVNLYKGTFQELLQYRSSIVVVSRKEKVF